MNFPKSVALHFPLQKFSEQRNKSKMKKFTIEFCKEIAQKRNYIIENDFYIGTHEYLNFVHLDCGFKFPMEWNSFYIGRNCPLCSGSMKLELSNIKEIAKKEGYEITDDVYINCMSKLTFVHLECGRPFPMGWDSFRVGQRCPKCSHLKGLEKVKLTLEHCVEEAFIRGYTITDTYYKNISTKLNFVHSSCGFNFPMSWRDFYHCGNGCPRCAYEKQESYMATELKKYYCKNFNAVEEYGNFKNPKTNHSLPFDIFIPKYNMDGYDIFIEVHGAQHYKFVQYWHKTKENFEYCKYKDRIKRKYAEQNGIYIEIDLRQKTPIEDIIEKINNTITRYG